mgnify:CR=1 FL=1
MTKHFTTRDDLYKFLDSQEHNDLTDGERMMDVQYTGAVLADAGWTTADESDGLLDMLAEPSDEGYWMTSDQARCVLDDIECYIGKESD